MFHDMLPTVEQIEQTIEKGNFSEAKKDDQISPDKRLPHSGRSLGDEFQNRADGED